MVWIIEGRQRWRDDYQRRPTKNLLSTNVPKFVRKEQVVKSLLLRVILISFEFYRSCCTQDAPFSSTLNFFTRMVVIVLVSVLHYRRESEEEAVLFCRESESAVLHIEVGIVCGQKALNVAHGWTGSDRTTATPRTTTTSITCESSGAATSTTTTTAAATTTTTPGTTTVTCQQCLWSNISPT